MTDMSKLLAEYKAGLGFKPNDVLEPRQGALPHTFNVVGGRVIVLEQNVLAPHKYTVIGESREPVSLADRFVKFEINGHEWHKVGRA